MNLMNSEGAYKAYRDALHNVNPPCVPYLYAPILFGIFILTLYFIGVYI